jgi:hypothetical protein
MYIAKPIGEDSERWLEWKSEWSFPFWSPDSTSMAYFCFKDGGRHPSATLMIHDTATGIVSESDAFKFSNIFHLGTRMSIVMNLNGYMVRHKFW